MKKNKFSILQISDLHKLKGTNYHSLLQTLLADKSRYEQEGVTSPSFIVVCGDVVHGADTVEEGTPKKVTWEVKVLQLQSPDGDSIEIKSNNLFAVSELLRKLM